MAPTNIFRNYISIYGPILDIGFQIEHKGPCRNSIKACPLASRNFYKKTFAR
jgi:hypothetical protein